MSHKEMAPLAFQAARSMSTTVLRPLVPRLPLESDTRSQRELSTEASLIKQELLLASLEPRDQVALTEAASQIGRRWLDAIPSSARLLLSDGDIRANLHYRTLLSGHAGCCTACSAPNLSLHDEGCPGRQDFRVSRHESVKHILAGGLKQIPLMQVQVEPFLPDLRRRNDIRIHCVSNRHADLHEEYDLKVMVLSAASNQRSLTTANIANTDASIFKQTAERIQTLLARNAKKKVSNLPALDPNTAPPRPFFPLVMSSGGLLEKGMFEKLKQWRAQSTGGISHSWMISSVAVALARARGRTFLQ